VDLDACLLAVAPPTLPEEFDGWQRDEEFVGTYGLTLTRDHRHVKVRTGIAYATGEVPVELVAACDEQRIIQILRRTQRQAAKALVDAYHQKRRSWDLDESGWLGRPFWQPQEEDMPWDWLLWTRRAPLMTIEEDGVVLIRRDPFQALLSNPKKKPQRTTIYELRVATYGQFIYRGKSKRFQPSPLALAP
jgi:hypothetical protein